MRPLSRKELQPLVALRDILPDSPPSHVVNVPNLGDFLSGNINIGEVWRPANDEITSQVLNQILPYKDSSERMRIDRDHVDPQLTLEMMLRAPKYFNHKGPEYRYEWFEEGLRKYINELIDVFLSSLPKSTYTNHRDLRAKLLKNFTNLVPYQKERMNALVEIGVVVIDRHGYLYTSSISFPHFKSLRFLNNISSILPMAGVNAASLPISETDLSNMNEQSFSEQFWLMHAYARIEQSSGGYDPNKFKNRIKFADMLAASFASIRGSNLFLNLRDCRQVFPYVVFTDGDSSTTNLFQDPMRKLFLGESKRNSIKFGKDLRKELRQWVKDHKHYLKSMRSREDFHEHPESDYTFSEIKTNPEGTNVKKNKIVSYDFEIDGRKYLKFEIAYKYNPFFQQYEFTGFSFVRIIPRNFRSKYKRFVVSRNKNLSSIGLGQYLSRLRVDDDIPAIIRTTMFPQEVQEIRDVFQFVRRNFKSFRPANAEAREKQEVALDSLMLQIAEFLSQNNFH